MSEKPGTRQLLIEATIAAIAYGGESSVRVSAIATAVGVKEPSVYHFFKNRDALVEAAQIERYRRSYSEMMVPFEMAAEMSETQEEFERAVRKIFSMVYAPERVEIRSVRMNVMGAAQSSDVISKAIGEINHETASTLARVMAFGQKQGWVTKDLDPMALAYWGIGQLNGRVMAEMNSGLVNLAEWDKVSVEAVLGVYRYKAPK
jgi:AcrR family transcriptional regulator